MYETIKGYYDSGIWSLERVWNVVDKAISKKEYKQITGFTYPGKG